MKRATSIALVLMTGLFAAFLLFMRYSVVASEGYPTWEAVRNMLLRDGEIAITLPKGITVVSACCDEIKSTVSIDGRTVTTKVGYSNCMVTIEAVVESAPRTLQFESQKLNSWNRICFIPVDSNNPLSDFIEFENGVEKTNRYLAGNR
jgi:hypothetical protein